jgi:hypothetical protein
MSRYFFHIADGPREVDREGVEIPSLGAARIQAVVFAGERLKDEPEAAWNGRDWRVEATDEAGSLLFTVIVVAVDAPAAEGL